MDDKEADRIARAAGRKPQLNFEATRAEKLYFEDIAKRKGMKLAALVRELLHNEGSRMGLPFDGSRA